MTTLAEARAALFKKARKTSAICPCCDKHVKIYRRRLNSGIAQTLVDLYPRSVADPFAWLDVSHILVEEFNRAPGDYGKLVWWELMQRKVKDPELGIKGGGLYRLTEFGRRFVRGEVKVRSHVIEYRSNVLEFDGPLIGISEALRRPFDIAELMSTPAYKGSK